MSNEFEEWARMEGLPLEWLPNFGFYEATRTEQAWMAWQASRQALVVELPTISDVDFGDSNGGSSFDEGFDVGFADAVGEFKARLCKAGVAYK